MSTKPKTKKARKTAAKKTVATKSAAPAAAKKAIKTTAKKAVAAKSEAPAKATNSNRGVRYTPELKKEVVDFVNEFNAKNGRGGQSAAARKFKVTVLTVSSWLKSTGLKAAPGAKAAKALVAPKGLTNKIKSLLDLSDQITKAESNLAKLKSQHASLSASIRSQI